MSNIEKVGVSASDEHRRAHQGDVRAYHDVVSRSSERRFGPTFWGVLAEHLTPADDATFVDLGTGPGVLLEMLRERYPRAKLVGVEVEPLMLESARDTAARCGAEIVAADLAEPLPLPDAMADVVTLVMTFHELIYPPHVLTQAWRLLKPGGTLVLYDWVKRPLADYLAGMDRALSPDALQHFREHCLFSGKDLAFLIEHAGFEVCELVARRGGNFAMVVAKRAEAP